MKCKLTKSEQVFTGGVSLLPGLFFWATNPLLGIAAVPVTYLGLQHGVCKGWFGR